ERAPRPRSSTVRSRRPPLGPRYHGRDSPSPDRSRMHEPPLYYLVGPAGHPNYGDEIITAGWLEYLADTAPDAEVWVDTHSPGPAQVLLGDLHPRVRFTDTLWRLCWEAPSDDPWQEP